MPTDGLSAALVLINGAIAIVQEIQQGNEPVLTDSEVDNLVNRQKSSKENALSVLDAIINKENESE
jgi:hypothetical protein